MRAQSKPTPKGEWQALLQKRGFTLIELLVVIAIIAILAAILLPVLDAAKLRALQSECTSNKKQLVTAWIIYAGDNSEHLAINSDPHVYNTTYYPQGSISPSWVAGSLDWTLGAYNTNTSYLVNNRYSLLGDYLGQNPVLFTCPADHYASRVQLALGWTHRARDVAMNGAIGDGYKYGQNTGSSPWGWNPWYVVKKTTDFHAPGPSECWVFTDEHPDSIDDECLYTPCYPVAIFTELPGNQLAHGCGMAFADGHAEQHIWRDAILGQHYFVDYTTVQQVPCSINDQDMIYLALHTPHN